MKLLRENSEVKILIEGVDASKKYYISGIFAQAEVKNRNGRIYPKPVMENAIGKFQPMITSKRAIGELNHPAGPMVNPERASHLIESLSWSGNDVIGKAKILTSLPMGAIAKGLIDEGVSFGVSTRGLGTVVDNNGMKVVQNDFMLNTIDIVGDPSAPDAFVEGIMEDKEWILDVTTGSWIIAEKIKSSIKKMTAKQVMENKLSLFSEFLNQIK